MQINPYIGANTFQDILVTEDERLSTDMVTVNLLKHSASIEIPVEVQEEIERNNKRIDYINEVRENQKRKPWDNRFPVGNTPVKDVEKLDADIREVKQKFICDVLNSETIHALDSTLRSIFDRFLMDSPEYTKYI